MRLRLGFVLTSLLLAMALALPVAADAPAWSSDGPHGGHVLSLALAPDQTLFAGLAPGGVFTSADGGALWQRCAGLSAGLTVSSLAASPDWAVAPVLLVSTLGDGIYRSADGGEAWEQSSTGLDSPNVSQVAFSPAFGADKRALAGTDAGLSLSENGGLTWSPVGPGLPVLSVALAPPDGDAQQAFAGTVAGLYASTDGGHTWEFAFGDTPISVIALSPSYATDHTLLIGAFGGAYLSSTGGTGWTGPWLEGQTIQGALISASFAEDGRLWLCAEGIAYRSDNAGASWTPASQLGDTLGPLVAYPGGGDESLLVGGGSVLGALRSQDEGDTWWPISQGLNGLPLAAVAVSPAYACDRTVFAGGASGIWRRTAWQDWQQSPLGGANVRALACSPDYANDQTAYAATDAGLYYTADGGETWQAAVDGLESPESTSLALNASEGLWLGTSGGVYYAPLDTWAWEARNSGVTAPNVRALARLNLESGALLLAGAEGGGVFSSTSDGLTWTAATRQPTDLRVRAVASAIGFGGRAVAFAGTATGLYRSTDGGHEWVAAGLSGRSLTSILLHPNYATRPNGYVGTLGEGIYYTTNGGLTWQTLNDGLPQPSVYALATATAAPSPVLYAATGGGVWRYGDPPARVCHTLPLPLLFK